MANFYVWEWGVLFAFGILNMVYGVMSWLSYDAAYKELAKKNNVKNTKTQTIAKALQADIIREWNSYAIEDIISAFTLTPLIPYWYVSMGMCEGGDENHWNCPEDWDEQKEEWFPEQRKEEDEEEEEECEGSDCEDEELWEEGEEEPVEDIVDDEELDGEIEDPLGLISV